MPVRGWTVSTRRRTDRGHQDPTATPSKNASNEAERDTPMTHCTGQPTAGASQRHLQSQVALTDLTFTSPSTGGRASKTARTAMMTQTGSTAASSINGRSRPGTGKWLRQMPPPAPPPAPAPMQALTGFDGDGGAPCAKQTEERSIPRTLFCSVHYYVKQCPCG